MNKIELLDRSCGCKGCRTCLFCEEIYNLPPKQFNFLKENSYFYCHYCNKAYPGWEISLINDHPNHNGVPIEFPGVYIKDDFLTAPEEEELIYNIDNTKWDLSQSGRRKQNFGPKCNFKKRKLQLRNFNGFPKYSEFVQARFNNYDVLKNYFTIEQCALEYDPNIGASIDPHIDDCWVWGERIVTVNLLSDSVLTMNFYVGDDKRYNLNMVDSYIKDNPLIKKRLLVDDKQKEKVIRIYMPRRSLLVMYGPARYEWEHSVLREDIKNRRVCLAYREFTPLYLAGGKYENEAKEVLQKSKHFWI